MSFFLRQPLNKKKMRDHFVFGASEATRSPVGKTKLPSETDVKFIFYDQHVNVKLKDEKVTVLCQYDLDKPNILNLMGWENHTTERGLGRKYLLVLLKAVQSNSMIKEVHVESPEGFGENSNRPQGDKVMNTYTNMGFQRVTDESLLAGHPNRMYTTLDALIDNLTATT